MDQRRSLKQLSNKKQFQVNMKSKLLFALTVATSLFLTSCYNDNEEDLYPAGACELTAVTYATTIKPIMQASCAMAGCHNNATASAGVRLVCLLTLHLITGMIIQQFKQKKNHHENEQTF
jgi:hypothetical protein